MTKFKLISILLLSSLIVLSAQLRAQDLPGVAIADTEVGQSAKTLINLASQQLPELFANGTSWRSFDGFFYKYFAASGVFVGINGDDLYLLGGQFGSVATYAGKVSDAIIALGGGGVGGSFFNDLVTASTLNDLLNYFQTITVSYDTITSAFSLLASVAIEAQGEEVIGGQSARKLVVTLSGSNLPQPSTALLWVDASGTIIRVEQNGGVFVAPTANLIGTGLISGALLALKAAEAPAVQAAIEQELASPTIGTKTFDNVISGIGVKTLAIEVKANEASRILFEISDFGAFSIATKLESTLLTTTTKFELKDIVLR